jgi:hypothetical protein
MSHKNAGLIRTKRTDLLFISMKIRVWKEAKIVRTSLFYVIFEYRAVEVGFGDARFLPQAALRH